MPALAWRLSHLLALSTLAVTQPLLAILGDNPTFFTAHQSSPGQVVALALTIAVVPAACLAIVEAGIHLLDARAGERAHLAIITGLTFLFVIQVVDVLPGPWVVPVLAAAAITAGLVTLYATRQSIRSVVSLLALMPILFIGLFLFVSPASSIVFPDDVTAVELDELVGEPLDPAADDPTEATTVAERLADRFPPIYLLVLDELPMASLLDGTGQIDADRWPNFARLADTSHVFTNATTIGFTTERAIPGMLTGRYETHDAPVYSLYPENLFTLLGGVYDISSSDPLVDLCAPSICDGAPPQAMTELLAADETETAPTTTTLPPQPAEDGTDSSFRLLLDDALIVFGHLATPDGIDLGLPSIGSTWGDFGGDAGASTDPATPPVVTAPSTTASSTSVPFDIDIERPPSGADDPVDVDAVNEANTDFLDGLLIDDSRVADFRREVAAISASDAPRLHYVHLLLPHVPWRLHANGETYADISLPGYFSAWNDDPTVANAGRQRHLLQLQFVDRLLGEYLDRLEEEGILDDATVIVAADHGISFLAGQRSRGLDETNLGGIAGVPIFYKLPGQVESVWHDDPVETVDIVPTVAAQLGVEIPWPVDGADLFGPGVERRRAILHPFYADVPEPFPAARDEVTADLLATFGDGRDGNLYGLAGLHDRIGTSIADLVDEPTTYCWRFDRPQSLPEEGGTTGFVHGELASTRAGSIAIALTIGDTLTGTSATFPEEVRHRVYALGDPQYWSGATVDDIGLSEIDGGRLRPIRRC